MRASAASRSADRRLRRREPQTQQYRRFRRLSQKSMLLNGVDQYGTMDDCAPELVGDFSMSLWFKVTPGSPTVGQESIWGIHTAAGGNHVIIGINYGLSPDPAVKFLVRSSPDAAWFAGLAGGVDIKDGGWHNFVFTYEVATLTFKVYTDGALELTHTNSGGFGIAANARVTIGQEWDGAPPSDFFQGGIAENALWSRTLTPTEAATIAANADPRRLGAQHVYMCGDWDQPHHPQMIDRGTIPQNGTWVGTTSTDYKLDAP